ncbi:hypothetical protein [Absidia glauca]|uniref:Uncharacterized protein n=1 Tax=Absidia glauca TaxID=4829 RepID=A0A163K7D9_ABSGL|nr:hypothetical protein [Absidia glauca]
MSQVKNVHKIQVNPEEHQRISVSSLTFGSRNRYGSHGDGSHEDGSHGDGSHRYGSHRYGSHGDGFECGVGDVVVKKYNETGC